MFISCIIHILYNIDPLKYSQKTFTMQGKELNNENSESHSGDGDNKDSCSTDGGSKRVNGTVDPEV